MGLNYERIMAYRPADIAVSYGERECILYALGIGLGMDPIDPGALKFVYERAGLQAFPTMAVVLGWPGRMTDPAFGVDERLVVAGDLKVVLHRPLARAGAARQPAAHQGGDRQGARQRRHHPEYPRSHRRGWYAGRDRGQQHLRAQAWRLRRQGDGDPGAAGGAADARRMQICDLPTPPNLALLYRLNGDENPLHADPERAKVAGFDRPILHGAASFGIAAHAVLRTVADYRPERLASIEARFSQAGVSRRDHPYRDVGGRASASRSSAVRSGATTSCSATGLRP